MTTVKKTDKPVAPDAPEGDGAKLVQVPDASKLTAKDIKAISADDGSDTPENGANADAAAALKEVKAAAKGDDARGYFHGQGGAVGL